MSAEDHVGRYLDEVHAIVDGLDRAAIDALVRELARLRARGGRLFFLGSGGGAAHASHAVNDFRSLAGFEAYTPSDNVAELTARVNDHGWETAYAEWLRGSRLGPEDMVFVFSVGGGDLERGISPNLVRALEHARSAGATICGIVGRDGGFTARVATACVVVPPASEDRVTPHTEGFQALLWHLLVSHPSLQVRTATWEASARLGARP